MTLKGKVIRVESASLFTDHIDRVQVRVEGAGSGYSTLELPNVESWELDDAVLVEFRLNNNAIHTMPLAAAGEVTRG